MTYREDSRELRAFSLTVDGAKVLDRLQYAWTARKDDEVPDQAWQEVVVDGDDTAAWVRDLPAGRWWLQVRRTALSGSDEQPVLTAGWIQVTPLNP